MNGIRLWTLHRVIKERCGFTQKGDVYVRINDNVLDYLACKYPKDYLSRLSKYKEALKNQYAMALGDKYVKIGCLSVEKDNVYYYEFICFKEDGDALWVYSIKESAPLSTTDDWIDCKREYRRIQGQCQH